MVNHTFAINDIRFEDPAGSFNLEYPIYPNLIDYTNGLHPCVDSCIFQLEPAFQFLRPNDGDTYSFNLCLDPRKGAVFTIASDGGACFKRVGPLNLPATPKITVTRINEFHCQVNIKELGRWSDDEDQRLICLRIFCSPVPIPGSHPCQTNTGWGVSISFLKPGGNAAIRPMPSINPADPQLTVGVELELVNGIHLPKYSIYKYDQMPFQKMVTLEPAFRLSHARYDARIELSLPLGTSFTPDRTTGDEVHVSKRSPARPQQLSQVLYTRNEKDAVKYRYAMVTPSPELPDYPKEAGVFGFYLNVAPDQVIGVVQPPCRPGPAFAHVDPIMMHDPPPGDLP